MQQEFCRQCGFIAFKKQAKEHRITEQVSSSGNACVLQVCSSNLRRDTDYPELSIS
jgi:hypothetical protein